MSDRDEEGEGDAQARLPDLDSEVAELYRAKSGALRGYLVKLGCRDSHVDDIVHDAFMVLRQCLGRVPELTSPVAYLFVVARHRFTQLCRRRTGLEGPGGRPPDEIVAAGDAFAEVDTRDALQRALAQLSPRQQQVLLLRFRADLSVEETASVLGIDKGNVKRITSDAKKKIAELLCPTLDGREEEG